MYLVYLPYSSAVELASSDPATQAATAEKIADEARRIQRMHLILAIIGTTAAVSGVIATFIELRRRRK